MMIFMDTEEQEPQYLLHILPRCALLVNLLQQLYVVQCAIFWDILPIPFYSIRDLQSKISHHSDIVIHLTLHFPDLH